jgi:arginine-tRNA-protein transferase
VPSRSQRRCANINEDLEVALEPVAATPEVYDLYRRYLGARHPGGGMDGGDVDDFRHFVACAWSPTRMLTLRKDGRLLGVAVIDLNNSGASAVYTFFDPDQPRRALGTFAILSQIELARRESIRWLYLGYWIEDHPKMAYKTRFRPIELLRDEDWVRIDRE